MPIPSSSCALLAGFAEAEARPVAELWRPADGRLEIAGPGVEVDLVDPKLRAVALGPELPGERARACIERAVERHLGVHGDLPRFLVLAAGALEPFEEMVEQDRVYYLSPGLPHPAATAALLAAACRTGRWPPSESLPAAGGPVPHGDPSTDGGKAGREAPGDGGALGFARPGWTLATPGEPVLELLGHVEEIERGPGPDECLARLEDAVRQLVPCRVAECRWHDGETQTLWRSSGDPWVGGHADGEKRDSAAAGLVGFVARTGETVCLPRVGDDPRYDADADNRGRSRTERFVAVALPEGPGAGPEHAEEPEAVLTVARGSRQKAFHRAEVALLERLAREAGPILRRRRLAVEEARRYSATATYRQEALAEHRRGFRRRAEPLRVVPGWLTPAFRLVAALFALTLLGLPFVSVPEVARGTAVVRSTPGDGTLGVPAEASVRVLMPARYGPRLEPGMPLRLTLDGFPGVEQRLILDVVEPSTIPRLHASERFGVVPAPDPHPGSGGGSAAAGHRYEDGTGTSLVVIRARLGAPRFESGGNVYPYRNGMTGRVHLEVGRRRVVLEELARLWR